MKESGGRVHVGTIVSDDDTTMQYQLQNTKNGGMIGDNTPQTLFLAGQGNVQTFFQMVTIPKRPALCETTIAL